MTAKEYLEKAYRLNQVIDIKLEEVSALRSLTTRVTTAFGEDKIKTSKKRSPMEDVLVRLMDLENEVNIDIDRLISLKKEIIETITQVDDYNLRLDLALRYINQKS